MFKVLTPIGLIVLILLNSMVFSLIQGSYVLNKAHIIENFCVNKSQPELNCDGKCYLAQQLQAEKERQEQEQTHHFSTDFGQYQLASTFSLTMPTYKPLYTIFWCKYLLKGYFSVMGSVLLPPKI
ncbi:hypothetical protein A3SI_01691 [Nitritalea halalkaliphila LW7]|uniref:Uncharacterized protein n=1 Tax=Nitritalea halalkaliphila LW7 TaxID=1189621 RepID=I5CA90_9BACT|nr:hypothetical protein [Nitritalea halalkaliphila]EIM78742.1 hypothetical protein A3SI_01691 [Nitritalea halalkaliphila LW7]